MNLYSIFAFDNFRIGNYFPIRYFENICAGFFFFNMGDFYCDIGKFLL